MGEALRVRLGGYAPADSPHSRALDRIAAQLRTMLDGPVQVAVDHNVLDSGRPVQALLDDVEQGVTTACYFSTSYLADRVPALGIVDLPYLFASLGHAHACLDGELGALLSERTRAATGLVPLGYWDNGFRHLSNRRRPVRAPADCRGLRVRLQPNRAHAQLFRALGAEPVMTDLRDGIARLRSGELDAQENPLANFVSYGLQELHPHLSMTAHVYGARGVYASAAQLRGWPDRAVEALGEAVRAATGPQRAEAAAKEDELRGSLGAAGVEVLGLSAAELDRFRAAAEPVLASATEEFDTALFDLVAGGAPT